MRLCPPCHHVAPYALCDREPGNAPRACAEAAGKAEDDADVEALWLHVYQKFIEAVDAVDNGVDQFEATGAPRYEQNTTLSSRVGHLNPAWNERATDGDRDLRFKEAMALAGGEFLDRVLYAARAWLPGRARTEAALRAAPDVHPSGAPHPACRTARTAR